MPEILIVDDELHVRLVQKRMLAEKGFTCDEAASVQEARALLSENPYELIMCDVRMPGPSGLELLDETRRQYPDTAVVMVSIIDDPDVARQALDLGAYGYLTKPFEKNELLIQVGNALRRRELEIDNRAHKERLETLVRERTAALERSEKAHQEKASALIEMNAALKVLLEQRNQDKTELENKVISNVEELILPHLESIRGLAPQGRIQALIDIVEMNLNNLISPLAHRLSTDFNRLTPNEIRVAEMVKNGRTNKEIAAILGISVKTSEYYRDSIRDKLRLKGKKINLKSYLRSLT